MENPRFPGELRRATDQWNCQDDGVFVDSQTILVAVVDGRDGAAGGLAPADSNLINWLVTFWEMVKFSVNFNIFYPTKFSPQTIFCWGAVLALTALTQPGPPSMVSQLNGWLPLA